MRLDRTIAPIDADDLQNYTIPENLSTTRETEFPGYTVERHKRNEILS